MAPILHIGSLALVSIKILMIVAGCIFGLGHSKPLEAKPAHVLLQGPVMHNIQSQNFSLAGRLLVCVHAGLSCMQQQMDKWPL